MINRKVLEDSTGNKGYFFLLKESQHEDQGGLDNEFMTDAHHMEKTVAVNYTERCFIDGSNILQISKFGNIS